MFIVDWVASLTYAQRDAIRTISLVIGGGCVPVFGFILTWWLRIIKRQTRVTAQNTQTVDYVNGKQVPSTLGEMVRRTMLNTEDLKSSDLTSLISDPRTSPSGRRRNPLAVTDQIPSLYKGIDNDE